eukprot:CAMPEP_0116852442 /NCGR_PEP_ID=MMETSP0418-20121206/17292_1 /TAXON_ID=1158023 /ORGANISM="Astrosyne radiata, Strain 13vi08-1A" /LENGTH=619 /DNA_ID=CAMNT_0004484599 /DNA_START=34 /DNA_END=1895 /DNA_ORIENTATION=+
MTRSKMEELCADLFERVATPIAEALKAANVTLDEIDGMELIGGGMRVPRIQQEIRSFLQDKVELGLHINSDESMALGAAFHGANISTAFKVRHVGLADVNPFPISIRLSDIRPNTEEEEWTKQATMFKAGGKVGIKKTIAFTHDKDVHCAIDYEEAETLPEGTELSMERYNVTGIGKFAAEMQEKGLGSPKVSLQFELSLSGVTELVKAEAAVEEMVVVTEEVEVEVDDDDEEEDGDEKKNETASSEEATEGKTEEKKEATETKEEDKTTEESGNATAEGGNETATEGSKKKKKKKTTKLVEKVRLRQKKHAMWFAKHALTDWELFGVRKPDPAFVKEKKKVHKRSLAVEVYNVGRIRPYSDELKDESVFKMTELTRKDKERVMLEEARNKVESYIYHIKNKLVDDEEVIGKVSTEEQREEIRKLAEDAEEWMYDDGYNANLATMEDKYAELSGPAGKIFTRVMELEARPKAMKDLKEKLGKIANLVKKWETDKPQVTSEERSDVLEKIQEVESWMTEMEEAQEKADPTEDPVFNSAEVPLKSKDIEVLVTRLHRKPKPKVEKNATKAENATNTTEGGADSNTTDGESTPSEEESNSTPDKEEEKTSTEDTKDEESDEL